MITASHNPAKDNGVKIIDTGGIMMEQAYEPLSEKLINAENSELSHKFSEIITTLGISFEKATTAKCLILIGKDTRTSSPTLADAVMYFFYFFLQK